MAKTLNEAGVKRLIQEIKGANKNLNTPIPISTENTPESMAQNVKNIADYVEKAKAAGIDTTKSFRVTLEIEGYPLEGIYDIQYSYACGLQITDDGYALLYNIDVTTGEVFTPCEIVTARSIQKVTSDMLAKGARKPIILTPSTTEVDEETYQKLLSDDVDVVFKTGSWYVPFTMKEVDEDGITMDFSLTEPDASALDTADVVMINTSIRITKNSPHRVTFPYNETSDLDAILQNSGYLKKFILSSVLQEIDLTGTDAERKAKLDQFETDWKALTGASDLTGARFVGLTDDYTGVFTYDSLRGAGYFAYAATGESGTGSLQLIQLDTSTGSLTITPLFSHLEAITIYTDNTPEHMQANLDNIAAYEANLQALGVDTNNNHIIPIKFDEVDDEMGTSFPFGGFITTYGGYEGFITSTLAEGYKPRHIWISQAGGEEGKVYLDELVLEKQLDNYTSKVLNAKSLEAITIKTGNTPKDKAANVAAIKAYVDNLKLLGVDTTLSFQIPIYRYDNNYSGTLVKVKGADRYTGWFNLDNRLYPIVVTADGTYVETLTLTTDGKYSSLTTTSKQIIPAINEVNALAKSKQDALTSGTNIKTVNGQSLLGSGDIAISGGGDVTKAGNNIFTGNNTFTTFVHFSRGIEITNANEDMHYYLDLDSNTNKFRISDDSDMDVEVTGVDTPTQDNAVANKKYVDDKVAAAGGGSAPVLVDIDDIFGSAGNSVPVDVFNKIANAASAKTPIFGYSKLVNGQKTTYEIIPLYVKNVSTADTNGSLSIQFIAANAYNSVGIMKRSDTECSILISSSRPFALDTSVNKSSTRGIQSSAVWNEIHSEPMTVNTATSGVTILSSTDKHKILCYTDSGTQQYKLPSSPVDGETFLFLKVKSGHTITIQSGTGNQNIYDCFSGNSDVSKTIVSSTKRKITVTYSSTVGKWFLMADDFLS